MNLAFVDMVEGNMKSATRHYRAAGDLNVSMDVIEEVITFLDWFGEFRPDFVAEVNFALGYISFHLLGDEKLTREFFGKFRDTRKGRFEFENGLTEKWLSSFDKT